MSIIYYKFNTFDGNNKTYTTLSLTSDVTLTLVCKRIMRSDNVLADLYLNNFNNEEKIFSGKILKPNSLLYTPNGSNFDYTIRCLDEDGVGLDITPDNIENFYLQFSKDLENWV